MKHFKAWLYHDIYRRARHFILIRTWLLAGETMVKASAYNGVATELAALEAHAEDVEKSNLQLGAQIRALKTVLLNVRHITMQTQIDCAYRLDAIYVIASEDSQ